MFDPEDQFRLHTCDGGEKVVEDLFGGHAKFFPTGRDFHPACLIAVIAFREIFGAQEDKVAVVGEFHRDCPNSELWRPDSVGLLMERQTIGVGHALEILRIQRLLQ